MLRFCLLILLCLAPLLAQAQASRTPSHCLAFAQNQPLIHRAALTRDQVALTYLDHSMYQIDTAGGMRVITDFYGYPAGRVDQVPDVVTMNKGHTTHFTDFPDDRIPNILRGWGTGGQAARHNLDLGEMLIRNVTTDIRSQWTGQEPDGNSIFIFEVAGLCIGHLGHLHHIPSDDQFARIGRLDIVMAAVDGGTTLDMPSMVKVMERFQASVILPMHWFGRFTLDRFTTSLSDRFAIKRLTSSSVTLSQDLLPSRPTVMILPPRYIVDLE